MKNKIQNSLFLLLFFLCCSSEAKEMKKKVHMFSFMLKNGVLQSLLAKEICSCVFVTKLDIGHFDLTDEEKEPYRVKECLKRSNIPIPEGVLKIAVNSEIQKDTENNSTELSFSRTRVLGSLIAWRVSSKDRTATAAYYGPGQGCRLVSN